MMEPSPPLAGTDRLSSLPAELLDEILLRLDLRDAVRTSALSRAWRRLWESLPVISLSFPRGTRPSAIDSVLLRYNGPRISRFAVGVDDASVGRLGDWLIALSRRGVESIDINSRIRSGYLNLSSSIYTCSHLVSLQLNFCDIPPLPAGFAGFPALQKLKLSYSNFLDIGENQLEAIISRSPLLRVLMLDTVWIYGDFPDSVIQAPNLYSLEIHSEYDYGFTFGELPCLEDANIQVSIYPEDGHYFGEFLAGLAQVRNLTLFSPANKIEIPNTLPFTFHNLKNLKLSTYFVEMHPILLIFCLLRSSPNLEKLEIEIRLDDDQDIEVNWEFLNALWTDGMCAKLQVVRMINVNRLSNEICFMKLILSKAKRLCTFYVHVCPTSKNDPLIEFHEDPLIELLMCQRASAQVQILFKGFLDDLEDHTEGNAGMEFHLPGDFVKRDGAIVWIPGDPDQDAADDQAPVKKMKMYAEKKCK